MENIDIWCGEMEESNIYIRSVDKNTVILESLHKMNVKKEADNRYIISLDVDSDKYKMLLARKAEEDPMGAVHSITFNETENGDVAIESIKTNTNRIFVQEPSKIIK